MKEKWPTYEMWYDDFLLSNKNLKLYRFMNFKKFQSLMSERKLFFTKASVLSDKFEGGYIFQELAEEFKENKNNTFISCWTENDPRIESSMMLWELYSNGENSIVIGMSINHFFTGLFQDEKYEKYMGKINYLDPRNVVYPEKYQANSLVPFFLKRNHYNDEKEIRIIIQDMDPTGPLSLNVSNEAKGMSVPIDLEKIDEILVLQKTDYSFQKEINHLIEKAGLKKAVETVSFLLDKSEEISKKVACINEHNKRQLDSIENFNDFNLKNINYGTLKISYDASGNFYFEEPEGRHKSVATKKKSVMHSVQRCQSFEKKS